MFSSGQLQEGNRVKVTSLNVENGHENEVGGNSGVERSYSAVPAHH